MIENIFIIITITYILSLTLGILMERYLKIPWIFASLFFGILLSLMGLESTIKTEAFQTFSTLGMLMILFLIGFNIDLKEMKKLKKTIIASTLFIIPFEGLCVSLLLYLGYPEYVSHSFTIAFVIALSFATVGDAILLPILKEFDILKTKFGQLTLGIGTLDDMIEVIVLVAISFIISNKFSLNTNNQTSPFTILISLIGLIAISLIILMFKNRLKTYLEKAFKNNHLQSLFLFTLFFLFITIAQYIYEGLSPVAAILSGIISRQLFPKKVIEDYSHIIDFVGYMFLAPLFFLSIGAEVSLNSILVAPALILSIWSVAVIAKLLSSYLFFRKELGAKYSLIMGVGLSVRFSTSLIVQYLMYKNGLISLPLYSALIGTAILMKPFVIYFYSKALSGEKPP